MQQQAPRAFNRHIYHGHPENVFYGTDDGFQDGSFGEWVTYENHYNSVSAERRENIHMISVVGGLYGLNFLPLWRPKEVTFFDINPMAVTYFRVILGVWTSSESAEHFLQRLADADYETADANEKFVQENIVMRSKDELPRSRGSSKRSFADSWKIALDNFDVTKDILLNRPLTIREEPMESESFANYIQETGNTWIYASNITQFHFFDLQFDKPENAVLAQIIFPGQQELLDLADYAPGPVKAKFAIPLRAERL